MKVRPGIDTTPITIRVEIEPLIKLQRLNNHLHHKQLNNVYNRRYVTHI